MAKSKGKGSPWWASRELPGKQDKMAAIKGTFKLKKCWDRVNTSLLIIR